MGQRRRKRRARGGRDRRVGGRAWAERTKNMYSMLVTLEMSKVSGWLNARARCRVERGACAAGRDALWKARELGREAAAAKAARTRRTRVEGWGQGTRGERTSNIRRMSVTLDVSKLTGWLNVFAPCRVERTACDAGACGSGGGHTKRDATAWG